MQKASDFTGGFLLSVHLQTSSNQFYL